MEYPSNLATENQKVLQLGLDGSPLSGFYGTLVTKVGEKLQSNGDVFNKIQY